MLRVLLFLLFAVQSFSSTAQFVSIQNSPAVNETVESSGVAWVDFDHDGDDDVFITTSVQANFSSLDLLFVNNGDGSFSKVTTSDLVNQDGTGRGSSWADYNNDGYIDVLVTDQHFLTLFQNANTNVLTRVNGVPSSLLFSTDQDYSSSSWGDYNGDGFLDLFVAAYQLSANGKNVLYKNNGDGSFSTQTGAEFANTSSKSLDVTWIDYNNDYLLDLFISNYGENNSLYQNKGDGTFQKMDITGLTTSSRLSVGSSWADYDNDGDFDVIVVVNANSNNIFFENNGDGTFTEKVNAITSIQATSSAWADFDNDGFIDLVVVGNTANRKTYLFKNNGNKTFTDVSTAQGITNAGYSQGVAWGDYNKDGFLDMFIVNGYDNTLSHNDILYSNTPNDNKWISVKLKGVHSNKSAIGTVVKVKASGKTQTQLVQSQTGKNSMNSLNVEFGLGQSIKVDTMLIEWPLKGYQEFLNVNANQFMEIQEVEFLTAPSSLTGANPVYKQVNLSWTDNSTEELGFRIERSKGDQKNFKAIGTTAANTTGFQDLNLQEGVTYYYRVAARRENSFSLYSNVTPVYLKKNQTVTFAPIGEKYLDSEPFKLIATSSSGLPTNFSIIEGQDKVTLIGDMLTIITLGLSKLGAFQSGNDFYFSSPIAEQVLDVKFITGVEDFSDILKIYPNPSMDYIFFQTSPQKGELIKIFNTKGQLVYSFVLSEEYSNIPVSHLPEGLYVIISKWGASRFVKGN